MPEEAINQTELEALIVEAKASGGSERANYQLFVERLCGAFELPKPAMAREENKFNDYVFERSVSFKHPDGTTSSGFIDCYKRNCFILEAKQSRKRNKQRISADQQSLLPEDHFQLKGGHARQGTRGWDQVMLAARKQAEDYARALPVEHGYPPFLIVVDVGNVIEIFADFSGQGKNYAHFPDRQTYRISTDDLRSGAIQARLSAIWTNPLSLDPARVAAEVTRDIADRLARIARQLERRYDPKIVAEFLMRCLFTMFAEDVGLIPDDGFHKLIGRLKSKPEHFVPAVEGLWKIMDSGGYAPHLEATLRRFNGALFKNGGALELDEDALDELFIASSRNWSQVEPAIFGTLLERALDPRERSKLGAHYTPRAFVERLVVPTIIEPLKADWELVQGQVKELGDKGDRSGALAAVKVFHHKLCTTRVLDPACGTGNFLYVSLELMKRLEGEVLEALDALGEDQARFLMEGETVNPRQFYGLELNARAVPIADLVLWIGYLKWQLRTGGLKSVTEPVLHAYGTIRQQDAVIEYDRREVVHDEHGAPLKRWDGVSKRVDPITGADVPDLQSRVEVFRYTKPRPAKWPAAEFIVGNPPFLGTRRIRLRLGDGYVDALRRAYPEVVETADLVAYWWHEAARRVAAGQVRRFGFITTNSISQSYNRPVMGAWLDGPKAKLHLEFAVADHPWIDEEEGAAVRIAISVVAMKQKIPRKAVLGFPVREDATTLKLTEVERINSTLQAAVDVSTISPLAANKGLCFQGVVPAGAGFKLTHGETQRFPERGLVKHYLNGKDITQVNRKSFIIDAFGVPQEDLRNKYPATYQHLLTQVRPEREQNKRESYRRLWWLFAEPRPAMRAALRDIKSFIGTPYTSKHRIFTLIEGGTVPDAMVYAIAVDKGSMLACLSGRAHVAWALAFGGRLGVGNDPRYHNSVVFEPFPFPAFSDLTPTLLTKLETLGQRLDAFRKERLAKHDWLTLTGLYNVLDRMREAALGVGGPLTDEERKVHQAGLISMLGELHDEIDRAVLTAYGWDDLAQHLVGKPGGTLPSSHKDDAQQAAEGDLLTRLTSLNQSRAAAEKKGDVLWVRPEYQAGKGGVAEVKVENEAAQLDLAVSETVLDGRPKWPKDGLEQIKLVRDVLAKASAPALSTDIAAAFNGRGSPQRRDRISQVLQTLVATGVAWTDEQSRYFLPR